MLSWLLICFTVYRRVCLECGGCCNAFLGKDLFTDQVGCLCICIGCCFVVVLICFDFFS